MKSQKAIKFKKNIKQILNMYMHQMYMQPCPSLLQCNILILILKYSQINYCNVSPALPGTFQ